MLNRVAVFGRDNASDFAPDSKAAGLLSRLQVVIKEIETARTGQQGGRATARAVLIDALRLDLKNIVRTARDIAKEAPGFADRFRLPENPSQTALLTAAGTILEELQKPGVADKFIPYELPSDFVAVLEADLKAIGKTKETQNSDDTRGVENTAVLSRSLTTGLDLVDSLHAIMHNKYDRQPEKLRAWQSARHTERRAQKAKPETSATSSTAPVTGSH
jgi:hypothetical protein